jgi:hypothetical protein
MSFNAGKNKSKSESGGPYWENTFNSENKSGSQTNAVNMGPWAGQQPYLTDVFDAAQRLFSGAQGANQNTQDAYKQYGDVSQSQLDRAQGQQGGMESAWNALRGQQQQATDRYNQVVDGVLGMGMNDFQQQAADFAGKNPYLDQAVSQSWGNAQKMLNQQVGGAGGINHGASMGGNMASSRAGVAEGLATSEAANNAQQNELAMRQAAYDQGLGQANQVHQGRMGMAGLLEQNAGDMAQLLGGQQASEAAYQQMIEQALSGIIGGAAGGEQSMWNPLGNYYGIVGDKSWGDSGSNTTSYNESSSGYGNTQGETPKTKSKSSGWNFGFSFGG